ncbi:hypothetical protein E2C01_014740 [Portunus trituberculatus]|uniref:Uncharacterized protein n=1 Tax=Portunus trituberculatus TaxID=210409 RepID=A0A5B7DKR6_PORTR|nr:hypothetical protein [Portunus trituberculatus]
MACYGDGKKLKDTYINSGARYQKVTTTGSRSASGFKGELKRRAKPISAIFTLPRSVPSPITRILAGFCEGREKSTF